MARPGDKREAYWRAEVRERQWFIKHNAKNIAYAKRKLSKARRAHGRREASREMGDEP